MNPERRAMQRLKSAGLSKDQIELVLEVAKELRKEASGRGGKNSWSGKSKAQRAQIMADRWKKRKEKLNLNQVTELMR